MLGLNDDNVLLGMCKRTPGVCNHQADVPSQAVPARSLCQAVIVPRTGLVGVSGLLLGLNDDNVLRGKCSCQAVIVPRAGLMVRSC